MSNLNLKNNKRHHEVLSDGVREIIGYRPHWIVRKVNAILFIVIIIVLGSTSYIGYPDIVKASARLQSLNPPKLIVARSEGKLLRLFVKNEDEVKIGQHLALIEDIAEYEQITLLQNWTNKFIAINESDLASFDWNSYTVKTLNLGRLQSVYQRFCKQIIEIKRTLPRGYYQERLNGLHKDVGNLYKLKSLVDQQQKLITEDRELQGTELKAYESLAKDKIIAPLELNQYKSRYIAKDQALKQINAQLASAEITIQSKYKEIIEVEKLIADTKQEFFNSLLALKTEIEEWIEHYVVIASENGKVLFVSTLIENEYIKYGQDIFYIAPDETKYFAELTAPQRNLGKVKVGQPVEMKLESYSAAEYGYLQGRIEFIASIPNRRDSFLIKVTLPNGLITNQNHIIQFRNNLSAQGEIITDSRNLLDRLVGELKNVIYR